MADLLKAALDLLEVADYLECISVVTGPIEATLLATGQSLYRAIAENPTGWLTFANRIHSRAIFKEALIHTVGMYNTDKIQTVIHDGLLADEILPIVERKAQEVLHGVSEITRRLVAFYPMALKREVTVGRIDKDNTGRADYGNDIFAWMSLSVFRHWLGDMLATDNVSHAKDMGFCFIQLIAQGGQAYLHRAIMQQRFHHMFPMSAKGMNVVEFRLTEIKEAVKGYVKPYARPTCQLDLHRFPVKHFTHINVAPEDFPWHQAMIEARDRDIRRTMYGRGDSGDEEEEEMDDEDPHPGDGYDEMDGGSTGDFGPVGDGEEFYDGGDYDIQEE